MLQLAILFRCGTLSRNVMVYIRKTIIGCIFEGDFTNGQNVYFSIFCISIHDKDFDKAKNEKMVIFGFCIFWS